MKVSLLGRAWLLLALCLCAAVARAEVKLAAVFTDHMLLQRELSAPVWGTAEPGEQVTVRFAGQEKQTKADKNGRWLVRLEPLQASAEGRQLEAQGSNTVAVEDVLVGDVWICSGQSNMEWSVGMSANAKEEIAAARYPEIRLFDVEGHHSAPLPKNSLRGTWSLCTPESVARFSAVGYYFGRQLHQETGVPIGLIGTNWGGTRIEPWTPPVGFRSVPELKALAEKVNAGDPSTPAGKTAWSNYFSAVKNWAEQGSAALEEGRDLPPLPGTPGPQKHTEPSAIYNAMVHPLAPYGVRGAIWYQGESNGGEGIEYFHKMQALIRGWREVWNQENFPLYFYFVQLANFQQPNPHPDGGDGWARLREAQRQALTIPHTGMAVTIDIGEAGDIHPRNKQDVGRRLAQWGLRDVYKKDVVVSGPLFRELKIEGNKARVYFDHVGDGLMVGRKEGLAQTQPVADGKLKSFAIAGEDRKWHWAEATIDGDTVLVSSPEVPNPVAVRYAYSMNPQGANLYNQQGLPASPFRSDTW